ncbi:MAG: 30S ribosomal protein S9 [Candidatus Dadabacteria bacterium]|nr:30S ribosomal protein S9 [Candidatus Dadabacteria bacterium]NIQ14548.1 30S ribosomal protein S9 [Candidatus Dadabacteria bacterium]
MSDQVIYNGTGRRKTSVARVWLKKGDGNFKVNKRDVNDYFPREAWQLKVKEPLNITETLNDYDVLVTVKGGGLTGQAGAVSHGLSRALIKANETLRKKLKVSGLLKRDPRMVESKKYGKRKARRGQQFSKR